MTQSLAKYHARAPRYILNTDDDFLIRIAGPRQVPWEEGTEIRNVSLTGLAFTAPDDLCPLLGEVIKIQFTVPSNRQMACHAIVTRLDSIDDKTVLVGVHFYKLEMAHRVVLAQGISRKFRDRQGKMPTDLETDPSSILAFLPQIFFMGSTLYLWLVLMFGYFAWGANDWIDGFIRLLKILS